MAILLSKAKIGEAFGVSPRTIETWQRDGLPLASKRGQQNAYNLADCIAWKLKQVKGAAASDNTDYLREKARLAKAQADKTEQQVKQQSKDLIPFAEVTKTWRKAFAQVKTAVLSLPSTIRQTEPTLSQISYETIEDVCRRVLTDMHNDITGATETENDPRR